MKRLLFPIIALLITVSAFAQKENERPFQLAMITPLSTGNYQDSITYHFSLNMIAGFNHGINGAEIGGVANITRTDVQGAQVAGVSNIVFGNINGTQVGGVSNYSSNLTGTQISGVLNQAQNVTGVQVSGLVNHAQTVDGFQIGIINIADTVRNGVSFGLINVVRSGLHRFEVSNNDVTQVNLSFRSGTDRLYGIYTAGIQTQVDPIWSAGLGMGSRFHFSDKMIGSVEVTGSMLNTTNALYEKLNTLNRFSINAGYQLNDRIFINGGPVLNVYVAQKKSAESDQFGYAIGNGSLYNKTSGNIQTRMWLGYQVGIWF